MIIEQNLCSVLKILKTVKKLSIYKYCFLYGIAVVDIHFENNFNLPALTKIDISHCTVRFYHELNPLCDINIRQGKVIVKKIGKYIQLDRSGSVLKKKIKKNNKSTSKEFKKTVKSFFLS